MECTGGTRYSLDATRKDEGPVHLDMAGPTLHYNSKSGELHCEGPVTGDIRGISGIAAESVPVIGIEPGGSPRTAPAPIKSSGPIHVKTADMTYNESTRVLIATKNVDLTQAGTEVQCDLLILDDKQHTLTMSGRFRYSDSQGKKFTGSQAVEHIDKRRVDVSGPVSYSDDQGNSVRSAAAKMQRAIDGSRTVTFSKNVDLKDKEGNHVSTSFLTIETDPKGNQRSIRTGPLNGRGTAKDG